MGTSLTLNSICVTAEKFEVNTNKIKIPQVCNHFKKKWINYLKFIIHDK